MISKVSKSPLHHKKLLVIKPARTFGATVLFGLLGGGLFVGPVTGAVGQGRDIPVIRMNDAKVIVTNPNAQQGDAQTMMTGSDAYPSSQDGLAQSNVYSTQRLSVQPSAESLQVAQGSSGASSAEPIESQNPLWELYNQVQLLTEEVRQLRGMVESAQNTSDQLDRKQKQNYVDLDERVSVLEQAAGVSIVSVNPSQQKIQPVTSGGDSQADTEADRGANESAEVGLITNVPDTGEIEGGGIQAVGASGVVAVGAAAGNLSGDSAAKPVQTRPQRTSVQAKLSEKEAYEAVYKRLQAKEFSAAKSGFEEFISQHPTGQFAGSALYWLAELSLRQKTPDEKGALSYIEQLIAEHPDHARIPDALYKQATLKYRRQEVQAAQEIFERILREHPDTTAARLADHQLKRIDGSL